MLVDRVLLDQKAHVCNKREEPELYIKGDLDCPDHKKPEPQMSEDSV